MRGSKLKRALYDIAYAALMLIMLVSGLWIELRLNEYRMEWNEHKEMSYLAADTASEQGAPSSGKDAPPDVEALRKDIPDIRAWIRLAGTQIDYPVVQGRDNDQYLHTTVYGERSGAGSIFIDAGNREPFEDFNTVIYGHHMISGSMFTALKEYMNEEFLAQHGTFRLTTDKGDYDLNAAAFLHESADSEVYDITFSGDEEKERFIDLLEERAVHRSGISLDKTCRLVTLSTCAYEWKDARYVLVCRLDEHVQAGKEAKKESEAAADAGCADGAGDGSEAGAGEPDMVKNAYNPWFPAMVCLDLVMLGAAAGPAMKGLRHRHLKRRRTGSA